MRLLTDYNINQNGRGRSNLGEWGKGKEGR